MTSRNSWHNNTKGQALVEMALAIFVLLLLILGIVEFGRAMYTKNTMNNSARAGARQAVVTPGLTEATDVALNSNCNYGPSPSGNDIVYQKICDSIVAGINPKTDIFVTIDDLDTPTPPIITNHAIKVTVRFGNPTVSSSGFQMIVPGFATIFPGFNITNVLIGEATMRYE